jgi:hypothetical protein
MKPILLVLGIAALSLGGCATYQGSTADTTGTVEGYDASYYGNYDATYYGGPVYPVYKQGSPNGQDMGGNRPEILFYR